jgi:hypothetical protein
VAFGVATGFGVAFGTTGAAAGDACGVLVGVARETTVAPGVGWGAIARGSSASGGFSATNLCG